MNKVKTIRDSNLELFRILLMLAIVAHHYVVNSGIYQKILSSSPDFNSIFLLLFGAWGKTGINCFLLITGYFMCRQSISLSKFLKLLFIIEFYKVVLWLIFLLSGYEPFSLKIMVKEFLPVTSVASGFSSCFLLFYLCIPFINILIRNLDNKKHLCLLVLLLFIYTILGSLRFEVKFNYVSWFVVVYLIGAYVRCYPCRLFDNTGFWGITSAIMLLLSSLSVVAFFLLKKCDPYFLLADSNKIFAVAISVSLFMWFKNIKIRPSKFINTIALSVFGVLQCHANSNSMRRWLWQDVLKNTEFLDSIWLPLHAVVCVLGVYTICTVIDYLRINFLEKPFFIKWNEKFEPYIISKCYKISSKIKENLKG